MKTQIKREKDIIGKTITDIKYPNKDGILILFFGDEYAYYRGSRGYDLDGDIDFIKPSLYNHLEPWHQLEVGIINQEEYEELLKEEEQREVERELRQYKKLKAKYA